MEQEGKGTEEDTDKKGRPRQRDYRKLLLDLRLLSPTAAAAAAAAAEQVGQSAAVQITLASAITPQGLGLKPDHLCLWLGQQLGRSLQTNRHRRLALNLADCVLACS